MLSRCKLLFTSVVAWLTAMVKDFSGGFSSAYTVNEHLPNLTSAHTRHFEESAKSKIAEKQMQCFGGRYCSELFIQHCMGKVLGVLHSTTTNHSTLFREHRFETVSANPCWSPFCLNCVWLEQMDFPTAAVVQSERGNGGLLLGFSETHQLLQQLKFCVVVPELRSWLFFPSYRLLSNADLIKKKVIISMTGHQNGRFLSHLSLKLFLSGVMMNVSVSVGH